MGAFAVRSSTLRGGDTLRGSVAVTLEPVGIASGEAFGTPALTISAVPVAQLVDTFNDNTIDTVKWPSNFGSPVETGGRARIPVDTGFNGYRSAAVYRLAGSSVTVKVATFPADGGASEAYTNVLVETTPGSGTDAGWVIDAHAGLLLAVVRVGFADTPVSAPIDPVAHAWLRLSEAAGTLTWETSPDGLSWSTLRTESSPAWVDDGVLLLTLFGHRADGTNDYAEFDNLNVPAQGIQPSGIGSAEAFGTATLLPGAVTILPSGVASAEQIGTATVTAGPVALTPTGIASGEALGGPTVTAGPVTITPAGVASSSAVGSATVTTGAVTIQPSGIASTLTLGTPVVTSSGASQTVQPLGIDSAAAFGTATVSPGAVALEPAGVVSTADTGTPTITAGQVTVSPVGIAASDGLGSPTLTLGAVSISPEGVASGAAIGTATVLVGAVIISPSGIPSAEAFGVPTVALEVTAGEHAVRNDTPRTLVTVGSAPGSVTASAAPGTVRRTV